MKHAVAIAVLAVASRARAAPAPSSPAASPASTPDAAPATDADGPTPAPALAPPGLTAQVVELPPPTLRIKPAVSSERLAGELGVGLVAGGAGVFLGAIGGAALGYGIECGGGCSGEFAGLGGIIIGGGLGAYVLGSVAIGLGVHAIGTIGDVEGSRGAAIGGAFLGAAVGGLGAAVIEATKGHDGASSQGLDVLATVVFVGGWVGGSVIGFNLTRSARGAPAIGAAVAFDRGHASLGIPLAVHTHDASYLTVAAGRF